MPRYRQIEIESSSSPPEPEEISKVESLLGTSLPSDFLEFLQVANGGYYEFCIKIPPENEEVSFGDVYLVGRDESGQYGAGTVLHEIDCARRWAKTPDAVLPFARDGGGSEVFLDLTPEGKGRVVAFVHGLPPWAGPIQEDRFIELAPSFVEYIDLHVKCEGEFY